MASDASAFDSNKGASVALDGGVHHLTTSGGRRRATAVPGRTAYDSAFFLRVAHANAVQTRLMKSSTIKLAESLKLLAEVTDLLRR
jgi:hypothetical protein